MGQPAIMRIVLGNVRSRARAARTSEESAFCVEQQNSRFLTAKAVRNDNVERVSRQAIVDDTLRVTWVVAIKFPGCSKVIGELLSL